MMMTPFEFHHRVLFQHCDPAGMVFYPRYFEMINACVETWFEQEVKVPFKQMHLQLGLSVPTVSTQTKFHSPSHLGDRLIFKMQVHKLGSSSLQLNISVSCDQQQRLTNETTLVLVEQKSGRPTPWRQHSCFNTLTNTSL
jgi:4-hydroxybenzoyl-CoA thioesterase